MKKIILWVTVGILVLLIAGVITLAFTLDKLVRRTVVTIGPKVTGVDVQLDSVELSVFNGEGVLRGFVLGNPEGYTSPSCIQFDQASLSFEPSTLLSDKVVVRHLRLVSPVITFEGSVKGNNFSDLRKGMLSSEENQGERPEVKAKPDDEGSSRTLQINELTLTGVRLNVIIKELGGQPQAFRLPDIQLRDLGTGPEGVTSGELARLALDRVFKAALEELAESGGDSDEVAESALKDLDDSTDSDLPQASRGVPDPNKTTKE